MNENTATLAPLASGPLAKPGTPLTTGALERMLLAQFPAADAEPWDRTGLTVGDPARLVTRVAVALDATCAAVDEAAARGANVLVTHHPAYLDPPEAFRPSTNVFRAVERGVSLMDFHTALDVSPRAQRVLPGRLRLRFARVLVPCAHDAAKGYGQLCAVDEPDGAALSLGQLAARCMAVFGRPPRVWGDLSRPLSRVATCTGSAGDVGQAAFAAGAECLVCGEVKYHAALDLSQAGLAIVDLGHDVSELPLADELARTLRDAGLPEDMVTLIDQSENWTYPETVRV